MNNSEALFPQATSHEAIDYIAAMEATSDNGIDCYLVTAKYERIISDTGRQIFHSSRKERRGRNEQTHRRTPCGVHLHQEELPK